MLISFRALAAICDCMRNELWAKLSKQKKKKEQHLSTERSSLKHHEQIKNLNND